MRFGDTLEDHPRPPWGFTIPFDGKIVDAVSRRAAAGADPRCPCKKVVLCVLWIPMSYNADPVLIAVDGGGTQCRFALLRQGVRTEVQSGGANVTTDFEGAIATLGEGLDRLSRAAGVTRESLRGYRAYFGLAGVVEPGIGRHVALALGLPDAIVEDDRRATVEGALGGGDGTVLGIGTGSFFARQQGGDTTMLGGWGFVLGDEASGADLGRALLRHVLHVADGLAAPTDLTRATLAGFGGAPADVVAFAAQAGPADYARFAPQVVESARAGDSAGRTLMEQGAAHIMRAVGCLGWSAGEPLCPAGGLAPCYAPFLPQGAKESLVAPKGMALDGGLRLAARQRAPRKGAGR